MSSKVIKEIGLIKGILEDLTEADINTLEDTMSCETDFTLAVEDGREYRFIGTAVIENIYAEECKQTIEDCYDIDLPDFIEIDWEATINNCRADGYALQFAVYDHEELNAGDWYIFRTN